MELLIKTIHGKTIVIDCELSDTILSLKKKIQDREGIPIDLVRLTNTYNISLEDNKTLEYYKIKNDSILEMKFKTRNRKHFKNIIKILDEKKIRVEYEPSDTIKDIKNKIYEIEKIPQESQSLFLKGYRKLRDEDEVISIKDSTLYLSYENDKNIKINIFIEKLGETIPINLKLSDKVLTIKEIIKNKKNIPINLQILKRNNLTLVDDKTLKNYYIKNNETINLTIDNIDLGLIYKEMDEKIINIKVDYLDKIKSIKNNIIISDLFKKDNNKLFYKDKQLDENLSFMDLQINNGDSIYIKDLYNKDINFKNLENENEILKTKIKELENELNKNIIQNNELIEKTKKLEQLINELKNKNIKDLKEIKDKNELINKEKKKVEELNQKLNQLEKIKGKNFKEKEILELVKKLNEKEEEIKYLKNIVPFELNQGDKLMTINFISEDQKIHCSFICKNTDKFSRLENLLYEEYPEYKESENFFLHKGNKVKRYNTLNENNIKNNDILILNQY